MPRKPSINNLTPKQILSKIRKAAQVAACKGQICYDKETLKTKKNYTDEQAETYISAFYQSAGTSEEQELRKARQAARNAVSHGSACLSAKELKSNMKYSDTQIKAYLEKYKALAKDTEEQMQRKASQAGRAAAFLGNRCLTNEKLKNKGYTDKGVKAYLSAYQASKGSEKEQARKKAQTAGRKAAQFKCRQASIEEALKNRGYTNDQIKAYQQAYKKSVDNRAIREQKLLDAKQLQQFLAENSEVSFDSDVLLGYEAEVLPSHTLTQPVEQYLTNSLEEKSSKDNGLLFAFDLQTSSSLTDTSFLSFLQETNEVSNQEIYSPCEFNI